MPLGLNAEPGAEAELPGVFGGDVLPQDCFGWPVMAGPLRVVGVMVVGVWCVRMPVVCIGMRCWAEAISATELPAKTKNGARRMVELFRGTTPNRMVWKSEARSA